MHGAARHPVQPGSNWLAGDAISWPASAGQVQRLGRQAEVADHRVMQALDPGAMEADVVRGPHRLSLTGGRPGFMNTDEARRVAAEGARGSPCGRFLVTTGMRFISGPPIVARDAPETRRQDRKEVSCVRL